ncbi:hypothetical protein, partial [Stieleria sp.]|uniref:hypothetical protein n=1 Tax=Stieleria sp. TaxID=2795976 RepID=UPI00356621C0
PASEHASAIDVIEMSSPSDSKLVELWNDLRRTATSIRSGVANQPLMAAHLAALATSYVRRENDQAHLPDVLFAPGGRERLLGSCAEIASLITAVTVRGATEIADADLDKMATKLGDALAKIHQCEAMRWNAKAIGHFARSVISLSAAVIANARPKITICLHHEKSIESHDRFTPADDGSQAEDSVDRLDQELAESIRSGVPKAVTTLMQLWYVALTHRSELETFDEPLAETPQPKRKKKKKKKKQDQDETSAHDPHGDE